LLETVNYFHLFQRFSFLILSILTIMNLEIAQWYGLDDRGFASRQGLGIFLFTTASRPALRPTKPPIQWEPGALFLEMKRLRREAGHTSI
jgi:hypothetical protein